MKHPKDDTTHVPGCTALVAYHAGRLRSPWSAAFRIEEDVPDGDRWYVVPCADPRCTAVRRMLFAHPPRRTSAAA